MKKSIILTTIALAATSLFAEADLSFSQTIINQLQGPTRGGIKRDITMALIEANQNQEKLTPEAAKVVARYRNKPEPMQTSVISGFFQFHWDTTGANAVEMVDVNNNKRADLVDQIINYMDTVYTKYTAAGYAMPPIEGEYYDVFLNSATAGDQVYGFVAGYGEFYVDNPNTKDVTEETATYSYMVLRNEYTDFGNIEKALPATSAHEFFHAVQMGYSADISSALMEMTATWSEEFIFPGVDDNFQYMAGRYTYADFPIDVDNYNDLEGLTEEPYPSLWDGWYASWLLPQYISEQFGNEKILQIIQTGTTISSFSDIMSEAFSDIEGGFNSVLLAYNAALLFTAPDDALAEENLSFKRGADYKAALEDYGIDPMTTLIEGSKVLSMTDKIYDSQSDGDSYLTRFGADMVKVMPTDTFSIMVKAINNDAKLAVALLLVETDTEGAVTKIHAILGETFDQSSHTLEFVNSDMAAYSAAYVVILNTNTDQKVTEHTQYTVTMSSEVTPISASTLSTTKENSIKSEQNRKLSLSLIKNSTIAINLYTLNGKKIPLATGFYHSGDHTISIDKQLGSGTYMVELDIKESGEKMIKRIQITK